VHLLPQTATNILLKVYATVAIAMAGRNAEIARLKVGDFTRVSDGQGGCAAYHIAFKAVKQKSTTSTDRELSMVKCSKGVAAIDAYRRLWPAGEADPINKDKNFFRRISATKGGKYKCAWTAQNVGRTKLAGLGKEMARALDVPNPDKVTGHWARRTALTIGANKGMNLLQLKAMSR
jgi:hypothetical protein